jgi:hypothetical protein
MLGLAKLGIQEGTLLPQRLGTMKAPQNEINREGG